MSFLDSQNRKKNETTPFSKKATTETKVAKMNADLHTIIKIASAKGLEGNHSITDHLNQAVEEYIKKYDLEKRI